MSSTPRHPHVPANELGAKIMPDGVYFTLFSYHAEKVTLCLFSPDGKTETDQIALMRDQDGLWHKFVKDLKEGQLYGYRVDGPYTPNEGHRFNANKLLIDPYAKQLFGEFIQDEALFGYDVKSAEKDLSFSTSDSAPFMPKCIVGTPEFDWEDDVKPETPWADTILYEAHVKGFSMKHTDISPKFRGTLSAFSDPNLIKYIQSLGVTAIEFLPVQSFFSEPRLTKAGLTNYWGYNPINYFAQHAAYFGPKGQAAFQHAVKALHAADIEVILDVVYNHTAESWELGPTLSYRGIDNKSYYRLQDNPRFYINDTGCGNTLNITHPRVLDLTMDSLEYWADAMRVDGFRFDLASTLGRNPVNFDKKSIFFNKIKNNPKLSKCKLIAEPWDIGNGGYVLGGFPKGWREWNDKFRDDVRSFWKNEDGSHRALAGKLLGSAEQFDHSNKSALSSINFITAHDGFTLHDVVSYNHKHNLANLEDNRDGHSHNLSDNMGVEGQSENTEIIEARLQRKKNMLATLCLSQGVPMLLAGDEFGHSQNGNNNAYCQDNDLTWLDWKKADTALQAFTRDLIALRKAYPHFTQNKFLHGEPISSFGIPLGIKSIEWISPSGYALSDEDWNQSNLKCFGVLLSMDNQNSILQIINRGQAIDFADMSEGWTKRLSTAKQNLGRAQIPANSVTIFEYDGLFISPKLHEAGIRQSAQAFGIEQSYRDISGQTHYTDPQTNLALLTAMGAFNNAKPVAHNLERSFPDLPVVYGAETLQNFGKVWGVTCALYGLKSDRNQGIGDFEDLACLCEFMAKQGADFIGINPVHALFPSAAALYAPYSPSSREFLNIMHIAIDKMPCAPKTLSNFTALRDTEYVDYDSVYKKKHAAFLEAFEAFKTQDPNHANWKQYTAFKKARGIALQEHALFDTIFETLPIALQTYAGWKNFPKPLQNINSSECKAFAVTHQDRIEYYMFLQWVAQTQVEQAQARAKSAGMQIGLYIDFAVGIVPGGSDAWRHPDSFASNVSLGAPGDMANPDGQKWNLLPMDPHKLLSQNFEPYRAALRHTMSLGGAVRIDHILGLLRAFWIPKSTNLGAYIYYPFDALVSLIATLSHAEQCIVFGEDLGTVPDGFRERMQARSVMGCNVTLFERDSHGRIIAPEFIRPLTMACYSNHDFPTLTGFWEGRDLQWRDALNIGNQDGQLEHERERRAWDKATLAKLVEYDGAEHNPMTYDLMGALMARLASSDALAISVQLDDLMLETLQANVPGTTHEQPNWKRKSRLSLEHLTQDKGVLSILKSVAIARN